MAAGKAHLRSAARSLAFGWMLATAAAEGFRAGSDPVARARWLQRSCRRALRVLGVRVRASGRPRPGTLIVANHLGYLDVLVLGAAAPVVFVAKREVRSWPVFGWFARQAGTRFVDRGRRGDVVRVAAEFAPAIAAGVGVVVFPEGTSTAGETVLPFRSSLLEPAVARRWPVVPVALGYAVPAGHAAATEVCWWGEMRLIPHLWRLFALPRIDASVAWGEPADPGAGRKTLAAALHARVTQLRVAPAVPAG